MKTITELRNSLRVTFGSRKYRITSEGEIHVYSDIPNSTETGWWFYGWVQDFIKMK